MGQRRFSRDNKIVGIYLIISPSNRLYVGLSKGIYKRWEYYESLSCPDQEFLLNSLKKYGPKNHEFIILEECDKDVSDKELTRLEAFYYHYFKSLGFNMLNLREPSEIDGKLSAGWQLKGEKSPMYGRKWGKHPSSIPIKQYTKNGDFVKEWSCAAEAGDTLRINRSHINQCCLNKMYSAGKFRWTYADQNLLPFKEENKLGKLRRELIQQNGSLKRKVYQYSKKGVFINTYDSVKRASDESGVNVTGIILSCNKKAKSAGGSLWNYEDCPPLYKRRTHFKNGIIKEL